MKKFFMISLVLLLLFAGCVTPQAQDQQGNQADEGDQQADAGDKTGSEGQGTGDGEEGLLPDFGTGLSEFKITYSTTNSVSPEADGEFTMYVKGENYRMDTSYSDSEMKTAPPTTGHPLINPEEMPAGLTNLASKTILGEQASCYGIEVTGEEPLSGEYCFSSDGILLYSRMTNELNDTVTEAIEFSRTVADEDMIPPEVSGDSTIVIPGEGVEVTIPEE